MKNTLGTFIIITSLLLAGCSNNQANGGLLGGVAGGLIGSAFGKGEGKLVAVAIGAVAGSLLGAHLGEKMDERDQRLVKHCLSEAAEAPVNKTVVWKNKHSGHEGSATTVREGVKDGRRWRDIEQTIIIDGKTETVVLHLYKSDDDQWMITL